MRSRLTDVLLVSVLFMISCATQDTHLSTSATGGFNQPLGRIATPPANLFQVEIPRAPEKVGVEKISVNKIYAFSNSGRSRKGRLPASESAQCQINIPSCVTDTNYSQPFYDVAAGANASANACLARAQYWAGFCATNIATASWFAAGSSVAKSRTYQTACKVTVQTCPADENLVGTTSATALNADVDQKICLGQAEQVAQTCGSTSATAAFYVNGTAQALQSYPSTSTCMITQSSCLISPKLVGTFPDTNDQANASSAACMSRAADYHSYCQNPYAIATFYQNGAAVDTTMSGNACAINIPYCANNPSLSGSFYSTTASSSADAQSCYTEMATYQKQCGGSAVQASYVNNGKVIGRQNLATTVNLAPDATVATVAVGAAATAKAALANSGSVEQASLSPLTSGSTIYKMGSANSTSVLTGWPVTNVYDGNVTTSYSSTYQSTSNNTTNVNLVVYLASGPQSVNQIILTARMIGSTPASFPVNYNLYLTNSANSNWVSVGNFTTQPNSQGVVTINLSSTYSTYGVQIVPDTFGVDNAGNHYLQMAEVNLGLSGGTATPTPTPTPAPTATPTPAPTATPTGGVYKMTNASSNNVLSGWPASQAVDGNSGTSYSSTMQPSATNSSNIELTAYLATAPQSVNQVIMKPRLIGSTPSAFPTSYKVLLTNSANNAWLTIGTYTTQPTSGVVTITLPSTYTTYGVQILPNTFGVDNNNNHYFQLAEINLGLTGGSATPTPTPVPTATPTPAPTATPTGTNLSFNQTCPVGTQCSYSGAAEGATNNQMLCASSATMTVQSATFGQPGHTESCLSYVNTTCGNKVSCTVTFSNTNCGGDPDSGVVKTGSAVVTCSGAKATQTPSPTATPTPKPTVTPTPTPSGGVYKMTNPSSNSVLTGWPVSSLTDGNVSTVYSSTMQPSATNSNNIEFTAYLATAPQNVNEVILTARMAAGVPNGFPVSYKILLTNSANNAWLTIGTYSNQPNSQGVATIVLPTTYSTYGLQVIPVTLGVDGNNNHYLQMAEANLGLSAGAPTPTPTPTPSPTPKPTPTPSNGTYKMTNAAANNVLSGWPASNLVDGNSGTAYSSTGQPGATNSNNVYFTAYLATAPQQVNELVLTARMASGVPQAFPPSYKILVTNSSNNAWVTVGTYTIQPNSQGIATIVFPQTYTTYGLWFIPNTLGKDSYGTYYLQMAEVNLGLTSSAPSPTPTPVTGPPAPTNLRITGYNDNSISLAWNSAGGTTAKFYLAESIGNYPTCTQGSNLGNVTSHTFGGLSASTLYYFALCSVDSSGNTSGNVDIYQETSNTTQPPYYSPPYYAPTPPYYAPPYYRPTPPYYAPPYYAPPYYAPPYYAPPYYAPPYYAPPYHDSRALPCNPKDPGCKSVEAKKAKTK